MTDIVLWIVEDDPLQQKNIILDILDKAPRILDDRVSKFTFSKYEFSSSSRNPNFPMGSQLPDHCEQSAEADSIEVFPSSSADPDSNRLHFIVRDFHYATVREFCRRTIQSNLDHHRFRSEFMGSVGDLGSPELGLIPSTDMAPHEIQIDTGVSLILEESEHYDTICICDLVWSDQRRNIESIPFSDYHGVQLINKLSSSYNPVSHKQFEGLVLSSFIKSGGKGAAVSRLLQDNNTFSYHLHKPEEITGNKSYTSSTEIISDPGIEVLCDHAIDSLLDESSSSTSDNVERIKERFSITGLSDQLDGVIDKVDDVADSDTTVLLQGESGVGKELFAEALHGLSSRSQGPFVPVNCGAIGDDIVESELFGSEKGGYTGALDKPGYFEEARGGTIFLDEIAEMTLKAQVSLLRVLQTGKISRVGSSEYDEIDVRVLAATHENLADEVEAGRFRKDLYKRVSTILIDIPSLSERREDILPIFEEYLSRYLRKHDSPRKRLTEEAEELLKMQDLPGNVRDLQKIAERVALLVSEEEVTAERLGHLLEDIGKKESEQDLTRDFYEAINYYLRDIYSQIRDENIHLPGRAFAKMKSKFGVPEDIINKWRRGRLEKCNIVSDVEKDLIEKKSGYTDEESVNATKNDVDVKRLIRDDCKVEDILEITLQLSEEWIEIIKEKDTDLTFEEIALILYRYTLLKKAEGEEDIDFEDVHKYHHKTKKGSDAEGFLTNTPRDKINNLAGDIKEDIVNIIG